MFRAIRKKKNEITVDAAKALLRCSRRGILAVNGNDGYPYAIPINYLYDEASNKIIFHGAKVKAGLMLCLSSHCFQGRFFPCQPFFSQ